MSRTRSLVAVGALLIGATSAASCGDDTSKQAAAGPRPVVVDTDVGADDALALVYLLQDPGVDVRAITVSGTGLVHCNSGVAIVAGLVQLTEHADVPIACGSTSPTEGSRAFPDGWREQSDRRYGGLLPAADAHADGVTAVDVLRQAIGGATRDVTVLTLGPFTNLAEVLAADPSLTKHIERVVAMAGAFTVDGNVDLDSDPSASASEWNVYVDPTAAQRVLDSDVDVTFVPLDSLVPVDPFVLRAVATTTSPAGQMAARLLTSDSFYVSGSFFLWDPLAASAVTDPAFVEVRDTKVAAVTIGAEAGRTREGSGRDAKIATVTNVDQFLASFVAGLDHRSPTTAFSRTPTLSIDAGENGACTLSTAHLTSGPAVIELPATSSAVAIGSLAKETSDAELNAYLATSPTSPPEWFPLLMLLQAVDKPTTAYFDLPIGTYDVVCFATPASGAPLTTGRAVLAITMP